MPATPVTVPLINPNENEAKLVAWHVKAGQKIKAGAVLATLETTKSTFELTAEKAGYVAAPDGKPGEVFKTGAVLAYIAETKTWKPSKKKAQEDSEGIPDGLRITKPALALAQVEGLDLSTLPIGPIVTEDHVRGALKHGEVANFKVPDSARTANAVVVYGGGGHGKAVIDLVRAAGGHTIIGVIDDGRGPGDLVLDVPVLGGGAILAALLQGGCLLAVNAVGGIGAMSSRIAVYERLHAAGFDFPTFIHPSAVIEPSAQLELGVQVFPHAYIGSEARIGKGCIVNTGAIVSHDCVLADHVNLAPGAILAGAVEIGEGSLIGMGVTINLNVRIGAGARVGNGATVKADVPAAGIVRAGAVWPE
jgi:sugar O-acyltransferase (sialic acid O-acetyltransferase NeuD family)